MNRFFCVLAAGALLIAAHPGLAQDDKINKEDVSFKTADGVRLTGTFYPSTKGGNSPVVLMLHKIGGKRTDGDWEGLAVRLQKRGYAALTFDFRGHGGSTTIEDPAAFWHFAHNGPPFLKARNVSKKKLELTDMNVRYLPYLMNDIAAARYHLDNRNDNGQCNTSNIIVIGAEDGASLGFAWIASEFYRPQIYQKLDLLQFGPGQLNNDPAGDDFAGAIWLSYRRHPGIKTATAQIPYNAWSANRGPIPVIRDKVQMWFAAGEKDDRGQSDAKYLYDTVLDAERKKDKLELTSKAPIKGTNLRGIALVGTKTLPTDDLIEKFIDRAVKLRPNQSQKKRNASEFKPTFINPATMGFQ